MVFINNLNFSNIVTSNIVTSNIVTSNIVTSNIVPLIKIFRPQKRAITYGIFETRFWVPIVINIKRIKWTLGHI